MTRREAVSIFAGLVPNVLIPSIKDPWERDAKLSKSQLKELVSNLDTNYPYANSPLYELPHHLRKINLILVAVAQEVL